MVAKKSFENALLNTEQFIFKIRHKNTNYTIDVDPLDIQTIFVIVGVLFLQTKFLIILTNVNAFHVFKTYARFFRFRYR